MKQFLAMVAVVATGIINLLATVTIAGTPSSGDVTWLVYAATLSILWGLALWGLKIKQ